MQESGCKFTQLQVDYANIALQTNILQYMISVTDRGRDAFLRGVRFSPMEKRVIGNLIAETTTPVGINIVASWLHDSTDSPATDEHMRWVVSLLNNLGERGLVLTLDKSAEMHAALAEIMERKKKKQ